jgi:hypothetical protein
VGAGEEEDESRETERDEALDDDQEAAAPAARAAAVGVAPALTPAPAKGLRVARAPAQPARADAGHFAIGRASDFLKKLNKPVGPTAHLKLYFAPSSKPVPESMMKAKSDFEETELALRILFRGDRALHEEMFEELLSSAQIMSGADGNVTLALDSHEDLKKKLVREFGPPFKRAYMRTLGLVAGSFAVASTLLSALARQVPADWLPAGLPPVALGNYTLMSVGAMAGMWLSFAVRKRRLQFGDLVVPESDMMPPAYRAVFVILFTSLAALLCALRVCGVSIGGMSTEAIPTNAGAALLFGAACGISEWTLGTTIAARLGDVFRGMSTRRDSDRA